MTFKPAHKQDNPAHKPGQLTFDRYPYLKQSQVPAVSETTLAHYIARKQDPKPHLTFDDWWKLMPDDGGDISRFEEEFKACWNAAQENKA